MSQNLFGQTPQPPKKGSLPSPEKRSVGQSVGCFFGFLSKFSGGFFGLLVSFFTLLDSFSIFQKWFGSGVNGFRRFSRGSC